MANNLQLDPNTWDIIIGRSTTRVSGLAYTSQLVKSRLLTILGEWKPDPTLGMPWFDSVMTKAPDISLIEGLILDVIIGTDHVLDVSEISLNLDKSSRTLNVSFSAISDWGVFEQTVELGG
jgi:hypothetical protein